MARRRRRSVDPLRPLSDDEIQRIANVRTGAVMAPEKKAIQRERERAMRNADAARLSLLEAGRAESSLLQEGAGRTQAEYNKAGQTLGSLAGAVSGQLGQDIGRSGSSYDPALASRVAYRLGGDIPTEHLLTLGANARRSDEQQAGIAMRSTAEAIEVAAKKAMEGDAEYGQKLVDLAAKFPGLRAQIVESLQKFELEKRAQRLYEGQFGLKQQEFAEDTRQKRTSLQIQIAKLRQEGEQPDSALSKVYGYIVDGNGDPILDGAGNQIPVAKTSKGSKSAKNTDYRDAVQDARGLRGDPVESSDSLAEGKYVAKPGAKGVFPDGTTNDPKKARYENDMSFVEAQNYLMNSYGLNRKQARRALVAAGWRPDGKRPKPKGKKSPGAARPG
jgi:hypothetical protein